jgi:Asp-tRNA(Asn)/Glu-tRNA(Gln) amidotransferase A subunit family amidase
MNRIPAASSPLDVRQVYADEMHRTVAFHNVTVSYSRDEPTAPFLNAWTDKVRELRRTYPKGIGVLIVIDSDAKPPSEEVRELVTKVLRDMGSSILGLAHVVEGRGFMAASKRSALSLVTLVARFPFPIKIFDAADLGIAWLLSRMGDAAAPEVTAPRLLTVARDLRFGK